MHVEGRHVHVRRCGDGPPLVMCHPSPGSSRRLEPLMRALAPARSVWAIDTPGYGMSDPLGVAAPTAADYADALAATIDAAGLEAPDVFGSHTGSKIALELAVREPQRVRKLVLDGIGLYTREERAELLAHYTPSLEPDVHGTHLLRYWHMQRDMHTYWPWYRQEPATFMGRDLPDPAHLHEKVVDFLLAGQDYWKGYHAAFRHDTAAALAAVEVPTLIVASSQDPLRAHLGRFEPSSTITIATPDPSEDPVAGLADRIVRFLGA